MLLTNIAIENYKSFYERQEAEIGHGFNLILGINNSGKTSLLEALDQNPDSQCLHRSLKNLKNFDDQPIGRSELSVKIKTSLHELIDPTNRHFALPISEQQYQHHSGASGYHPVDLTVQLIQQSPDVTLHITNGGGITSLVVSSTAGESRRILLGQNGSQIFCLTGQYDLNERSISTPSMQSLGAAHSLVSTLAERFRPRFYRFSANRRPLTICGATPHPVQLQPDANNLAYCLNVFSSTDKYGYETLCSWIKRIFPAVSWVQASPTGDGRFEIFCLPVDPALRRTDLSVPLAQMGTGIGNVIAILYVALSARNPQVIAIDEPNSFLHPKALRELLHILKEECGQHQYILTAHSADVIAAVDPSTVTVVTFDGALSSIKQVDRSDLTSIRAELTDLGIRMTDLQGRDRVLWVEGQTEELIFPDLLRHFCKEVAAGIAVLRVEHTGTLDRKGVKVSEVLKVYERLSQASALVPPMVAFLLGRESRSKKELDELMRNTKGQLTVLDRPMIEDYLLSPNGIASVLCDLGAECTAPEIASLLEESSHLKNAAARLKEVFSQATDTHHEFRKTRDVPALCRWLLHNDPEFLRPLGNELNAIVNSSIIRCFSRE